MEDVNEFIFNETDGGHSLDGRLTDYLYYPVQGLEVVYTVCCLLSLLYVLAVLVYNLRNKIMLRKTVVYDDYLVQDKFFKVDESLTRFFIFLLFVIFELLFSLSANAYGLLYILFPSISIDNICIENSNVVNSEVYVNRLAMLFLNFLFCLESFSYSMMIWLFGVSLLHLSYASVNVLKFKQVYQFLFIGTVFNFISLVFLVVPYTSILGKIFQTLLNIVSVIIVLLIAWYKYFPAVKRHFVNTKNLFGSIKYKRQKKYLCCYKIIFSCFILIFQIFILRDILFYSVFLASEEVAMNPCWFRVRYHSLVFNLYSDTVSALVNTQKFLMMLVYMCDIIGYSSFVGINSTAIAYVIFHIVKQICSAYKATKANNVKDDQLTRSLLP